MISGFFLPSSTSTVEVLYQLHCESRFLFYLTGSRALGIHDHGCDYDFFATYSTGLEMFLCDIGFRSLLKSGEYPPEDRLQELRAIYRHKDFPIDVQLVEDAAKKHEIQKAISFILAANRKAEKCWKKAIWQAAYMAYNAALD